MDLIALAAAKSYANKLAAGFQKVELNGMNLIFTLADGSKTTISIPKPADGKSVNNVSIDTDGSLLCHMSDGQVIDAGYVPTVDPDLTNYYTKEDVETMIGAVYDTLFSLKEESMNYVDNTMQERVTQQNSITYNALSLDQRMSMDIAIVEPLMELSEEELALIDSIMGEATETIIDLSEREIGEIVDRILGEEVSLYE